jgi:protein gp37
MAQNSNIEWTYHTWNPIVGCQIVSPGCTNCYAMKMAARIEKMTAGNAKPSPYAGTTMPSKAGAVWTGKVALADQSTLLKPLTWKKPRRIFVNSMGDLFADGVADAWIDQVFAVMALCPQHVFQVLTKRPKRMRDYLKDRARFFDPYAIIRRLVSADIAGRNAGNSNFEAAIKPFDRNPLPNVWLGVSVEDQRRANERIPILLETPAAVRWISAEPLLGEIVLNSWIGYQNTPQLDWVVCGGESGPNARPMHPDWARSLRDQCAAAGVPFFFKQWGEWVPDADLDNYPIDKSRRLTERRDWYGDNWVDWAENEGFLPNGCTYNDRVVRIGKTAAGDLLDGVQHHNWP